jgi:hypothetical protein
MPTLPPAVTRLWTLLLGLLLLVDLSPPARAEEVLSHLKRQHARLLIDEAGFADLKHRIATDETLRAWDQQLQKEAGKLLTASLPQHVLPDGIRLLSTSRQTLDRSYLLSLMFRLHGDRRYADRLWQEVQTVAAFPDFNPAHFLDTAEMTHALAIAYDWLYDTWSESQRGVIRQAIVRLGLEPGRKVYRSGKGWPTCDHNWNQVCNGGMTLGALAVGDEEPRLAEEILRDAVASVPRAMHNYAPDGAWGEGPGYWGYATAYDMAMFAGLQSALGTDFNLSKSEGFAETGLFPIYMTGPTGRCFNFSDSGDRVGGGAHLFWLAERFHLPVCTWFGQTNGRLSAGGMIWYRQPGQDPAAAGLPLDKYWRHVEVVTMRSRWNDPQAVFVGMQAGSNRVNHNHLDLGSFVLDGLGQRWAMDLGADDYNLPGYFGGKRYDYYRLRAEGHNTLVIQPDRKPDQDPQATAQISRYVSRPELAYAVADLTPAYAKQASRVERGVALIDRNYVLVQDEVTARGAEVWWFMHTPATVSLSDDGRTATLSQGKARYQARIIAPPVARFTVQPAKPFASSPQPAKQNENKGICKLSVQFPRIGKLQIAVLFTPLDGKCDPEYSPKILPLTAWK